MITIEVFISQEDDAEWFQIGWMGQSWFLPREAAEELFGELGNKLKARPLESDAKGG